MGGAASMVPGVMVKPVMAPVANTADSISLRIMVVLLCFGPLVRSALVREERSRGEALHPSASTLIWDSPASLGNIRTFLTTRCPWSHGKSHIIGGSNPSCRNGLVCGKRECDGD